MTLNECLKATLIPEHVFALHAFAASLIQRLHAKGRPLPAYVYFYGGPDNHFADMRWRSQDLGDVVLRAGADGGIFLASGMADAMSLCDLDSAEDRIAHRLDSIVVGKQLTLDECLEATLIPEFAFLAHHLAATLVQRLHDRGLPLPERFSFGGTSYAHDCEFRWAEQHASDYLLFRVTMPLITEYYNIQPGHGWRGCHPDAIEKYVVRRIFGHSGVAA